MTGVQQENNLDGLISALDAIKPKSYGENNHIQYSWSISDYKEQLIQIYFQSVRTPSFTKRFELMTRFKNWVSTIISQAFSAKEITVDQHNEYISLALYGYKMIAQLRDIEEGKGEYRLAYDMLYGWYEGMKQAANVVNANRTESSPENMASIINELAVQSSSRMASLFMMTDDENMQYGSFKDFKYICQEFAMLHLASTTSSPSVINNTFFKTKRFGLKFENGLAKLMARNGTDVFRFTPDLMTYLSFHPIIKSISTAYGRRILEDYYAISQGKTSLSLAGKWAPRASSKLFAPLRRLLYESVVPECELWRETAKSKDKKNNNLESSKKAEIKIETIYRQRLSSINRAISTVQVKQCEKKWSEIDFDRDVTSITLNKQKNAFAKGNTDENNIDDDRNRCASNFKQFMERVRTGTSIAKGKCVAVSDFVKQSLILNVNDSKTISDLKMLLDKQWEDKGKNISHLEDFIAMVDVSASMERENNYPINTAIGLGIRIAEKSRLGNRVMTFSQTPSWVSLDNMPSFTDRVVKVKNANWCCNTNFYGALQLILDAAVKANLNACDVGKLTLVILSDMQMDDAGNFSDDVFTRVTKEFAEKSGPDGESYPVPKIVFWNLCRTDGFPAASEYKNAIMISGGSDIILNDICEKGSSAININEITPWNAFVTILNKPRYSNLDTIFNDWNN